MSDEEYNDIDYDPDAFNSDDDSKSKKKDTKPKKAADEEDPGSDGDYGYLDDGDGGDDYGNFDAGSDNDMEPNDFIDYDNDEPEQNDDAELENAFLEAKDSYGEAKDKSKVVKSFENVLSLESKQGEKGEWGFRACKWLVRVNYQLGKHDQVKKYFLLMLKDYKELLVEKEKALKKLLESLEDSPDAAELFQQTLATLEKAGNKKAALRLELIQARVLAKQGNWDQLGPVLERLHDSCRAPDGSDDSSKGSQLLEIYALKIQLENEKKNNARLKELYTKALAINGLANPRVTGVIHECGGKAHMREGKYKDANTDFIEAFKNFDEGGAKKEATACLKYLVLANLLSGSDINPFDDSRAKAYSSSQEITSMTELVAAVQAKNIDAFERVLRSHKASILGDKFLESYVTPLRRELQKRVFIDLAKPYTNVKIPFIEKRLNLSTQQAEDIIVEMILDGQVKGVIDQVSQVVYLYRSEEEYNRKYLSAGKWASTLGSMNKAILSTVQ